MSQQPSYGQPPLRRDTLSRTYEDAAAFNRDAQNLLPEHWTVGSQVADRRGRISVTWYRDVPADAVTTQPVAPAPPKKRHPLRIALLVGLAVLLLILAIGTLSGGSGGAATSTARVSQLTDADYQTVDVRDLKKNPATYQGKPIRLDGEVFNIKEQNSRTFLQMWVAVPGGTQFDREAVVVTFGGTLPSVYEKSKITVFGIGDGTDSGKNAFGGTNTQPAIRADRVAVA